MDITTIGFDLAKTVFQVHGADGEGRPVLRRKLRRGKVLAFLRRIAILSCRNGSLCLCALLGSGTASTRAQSSADSASIRSSLRLNE